MFDACHVGDQRCWNLRGGGLVSHVRSSHRSISSPLVTSIDVKTLFLDSSRLAAHGGGRLARQIVLLHEIFCFWCHALVTRDKAVNAPPTPYHTVPAPDTIKDRGTHEIGVGGWYDIPPSLPPYSSSVSCFCAWLPTLFQDQKKRQENIPSESAAITCLLCSANRSSPFWLQILSLTSPCTHHVTQLHTTYAIWTRTLAKESPRRAPSHL